jgi:hypothetical protein
MPVSPAPSSPGPGNWWAVNLPELEPGPAKWWASVKRDAHPGTGFLNRFGLLVHWQLAGSGVGLLLYKSTNRYPCATPNQRGAL